jgi:hypothetical protein
LWGNIRVTDHLEDLDEDERMILKWIFKKQNGELDWNDLAGYRDKWLVREHLIENYGFIKRVFFLLAEKLLPCHEALCSV